MRDSKKISSVKGYTGDDTVDDEHLRTDDPPQVSTTIAPRRPDQEGDNADFDCRPTGPPVRRVTSSGGNQQSVLPTRSSRPRPSDSTSSVKNTEKDEQRKSAKKNSNPEGQTFPNGKNKRSSKARKQQKQTASNNERKDSRKFVTSGRRNSRPESNTKKTRFSVDGNSHSEVANFSERDHVGYIENGNTRDENCDNASRTDETLSTAPAPPSLRVGNHYALGPGAYRMSTGGVARHVNASDQSVEDNIADNIATADVTIPFDVGLTQDVPSASPPLFRPTISSGESGNGYNGRSNLPRNMDSFVHTDPRVVTSTSGNRGSMSRIKETSAPCNTKDMDNPDDSFCCNKRNKSITVYAVLFSITVVASIGAIIYATTGFGGKQSNGNSISVGVSKPPPPVTMEKFLEALSGYTIESLSLQDSPQSKALRWTRRYDDRETYTLDRKIQRFALMSLKYSITDENLSDEDLEMYATTHECDWYEITRCVNDIYKELELSKTMIRGELVPELALLSSLERLGMNDTDLVGVLPTYLGQISTLKEILMNGNRFRGSIPTDFGRLTNLEYVDFGNNLLSGTIPPEIGLWTRVTTLILSKNGFTGTIPSEIAQLNDLMKITMSSNKLVGLFPLEMGQLKKIKIFDAGKNYFDGEFVSRFESSRSALEYLNLESNEFTGSLPSTIGELTSLTELVLSSNAFESKIPSELGMLSNARTILLQDNMFTGSVPDEICELTESIDVIICSNLPCECCSLCPGV